MQMTNTSENIKNRSQLNETRYMYIHMCIYIYIKSRHLNWNTKIETYYLAPKCKSKRLNS